VGVHPDDLSRTIGDSLHDEPVRSDAVNPAEQDNLTRAHATPRPSAKGQHSAAGLQGRFHTGSADDYDPNAESG